MPAAAGPARAAARAIARSLALTNTSTISSSSSRRGFRTSSAFSATPGGNTDDAAAAKDKKGLEEEQPPTTKGEGEEVATAGGATTTDKNKQQPEAAPAPAPAAPETGSYKESLRSQGYGSARARAGRGSSAASSRIDEMPPLHLPEWFMEHRVSLYESRPISSALPPLTDEDRERVLALLGSYLDRVAVSQADINSLLIAESLSSSSSDYSPKGREGRDAIEALMSRCRAAHDAAYLSILAITQHRQGDGEHIAHASSVGDDMRRFSWWPEPVDSDALDGKAGAGPLSAAAQRWLANVRPDVSSDGRGGALYASPLANRPDPEYPVCMELLATVRAELEMEVPRTKKDLNRPVTVLAVLNRRGRSAAMSVMNDIATDLKADVVHLDASSIAALVGKHLGQTQYWSKGAVSMLGYAAAEMNGRLASRSSQSDSDMESEFSGMVTVALPPRLRSMLRKDSSISIGGSSGGPFDDRWEDLKMNQALDDLISSADAKRGNNSKGKPPRDLIIHIHDYIEISSLHESIISKLRLMVDRMRQRGRRVVIVGSSASDVQKQPNWKDQLLEMGRDGDVHILPFHAAAAKDGSGDEISSSSEWEEKCDNFDDNIFNIATMLRSLLPSASVTFESELRRMQHSLVLSTDRMVLAVALSQHVFDAQWVYRLVSIMIGSRSPRFQEFGIDHLKYALDFMSDRNQHWTRLCPGVKPPYFSPLHAQNKTLPSFMSEDSPFSSIPPNLSSGGPSSDNNSNASHGPRGRGEYDQHEKKLLSGLINAKDIHTTFDDIIVPPETKESLTALTSLSLERPDAFSYGVLKTERIPGCLLYGPPGTGKTLLAKAVAKESGANMLEVSAASINDMWLGQSEKNVRALFSLAKKLSPMVIFLDEADALLGARHNGPGRSGHRETITQFLREWDGLSDMRAFIMVATNRPFDLDEAVLRRLPRRILVDLPLKEERLKILRVMLKDELLAEDVDLEKLAADETELYSGSDLKNLCVSAAMAAVRDECKARDEYIATQKKKEEEEKGVKEEKEEAGEVEGEGEKKKYEWPAKRTLTRQHFDRALRDITASISEDMESLKAIRKFDEQYGDAGRNRRNKGKRSMGFEVVPLKRGTQEARVRQL